MAVINIRKAKRAGARLVVALGGLSGSGKTKSAVLLAWGLAGYDSSKVGFLDTENRRGSLYADALKDANGVIQEFLIGDLEPPFSPQRFSDAILEFQKAGVEVLVIDSITHEYEGQGGILEMREPLPGKNGKRDNLAKAEHKKFMNVLLQSSMHIICCVRAREKVKLTQDGAKTVYTSEGVQPIQEKNFMFEMTASLMMWNAGQQQQVLKCPDELLPILGRENGYITPADGKALADWVSGGVVLNPEVERAMAALRIVCEQGMPALVAAWSALPAKTRKAINPAGCPDELKQSAAAFDAARTAQPDESSAGLDELNSQVFNAAA